MVKKVALLLAAGVTILIVTACSAQVSSEQAAAALAAVEPAAGQEAVVQDAAGQQPLAEVTMEAGSTSHVPLADTIGTPILEPIGLSPNGPFDEELAVEMDEGNYRPISREDQGQTPSDRDVVEPAVAPALQPWIDKAKADLAQRQDIGREKVTLVSFETKVWPDAGLGCPQPGMRYKQVMVEGYLIRLDIDGKQFDYHGGGGRGPFLCEAGLPSAKPAPGAAPIELLPPPSFDD